MIKSICKECGISFSHYADKNRTGEFCSKKCYFESHRKPNAICEKCKMPFHEKPHRLKKNKRNYCSQKCRCADMQGERHNQAKPKRSVSCKVCGKEIKVSPSRNTKYCSKKCAAIGRRVEEKKTCENCNKEFILSPSQRATPSIHTFCSRECSFAWHKGENGTTWTGGKLSYTCCICGKETPKKYLRCQNIKYPVCSKTCEKHIMGKYFSGINNYAWKGGITPVTLKRRNSLEYKEWRQGVFRRDNFKCVLCGEKDIQAHHMFPVRDFPQWMFDIDNGLTLCVKCHKKTRGKEYQFMKDMLNGKYIMEILKIEASSKRIQHPLKVLQQHERDYTGTKKGRALRGVG